MIDIPDDEDSEEVEMSLPEEASSEIGSVSPPYVSTALPANYLSDSDNSITIPVHQVANRVLALVNFGNPTTSATTGSVNSYFIGTFPPGSFRDRSLVSFADRDGAREDHVN